MYQNGQIYTDTRGERTFVVTRNLQRDDPFTVKVGMHRQRKYEHV